jgi:type I restriction enzyme, S subunit
MVGDNLPQGWRWTTVEQVQKPSSKAIVSGPFGSNIGSRFFVESGVPVIRGNNLTTDMRRFIDDGFVFITDEKAEELKNCEAFPNDLIFTAAGTLGQVGIIPPDSEYPRYIVSNKQMRARLDENTILPLFAFYWLSSSEMVNILSKGILALLCH